MLKNVGRRHYTINSNNNNNNSSNTHTIVLYY